jgi:hypothetical protein
MSVSDDLKEGNRLYRSKNPALSGARVDQTNQKSKSTSSAERLANANISQSDSDIGPNMGRGTKPRAEPAKDKPKAKPKAKSAEYKMPKSTTPDMDTSQGTTGSRSSFDEGEFTQTPRNTVIAVEAERATPAPVEERALPRAKEETSRFSASNPMGMKKGGSVSSRGDGCAQRGKTKGRYL